MESKCVKVNSQVEYSCGIQYGAYSSFGTCGIDCSCSKHRYQLKLRSKTDSFTNITYFPTDVRASKDSKCLLSSFHDAIQGFKAFKSHWCPSMYGKWLHLTYLVPFLR